MTGPLRSDGNPPTHPPMDVALLSGFRFTCRPDCGLCCYAAPAVTEPERQRLLQIEPESRFEPGEGRFSFAAARPDGGACQFLSANRCRVHSERPFPCREYPLLVHVGTRAQATLVFTCPGVEMSGLEGVAPGPSVDDGLEGERRAVESELRRSPVGAWSREGERLERSIRKRWRRSEVGLERLEARARRGDLPEGEPLPLPSRADGIEQLPLIFVADLGRIALAQAPGGVELVGLQETGGGSPLGVYPRPRTRDRLDAAAQDRLRAYLAYWSRRDLLVWQRLAEGPTGSEDLHEDLAADLGRIEATVRERAGILARAEGRAGTTLGIAEVDAGIRATDADALDRRTVGRIL